MTVFVQWKYERFERFRSYKESFYYVIQISFGFYRYVKYIIRITPIQEEGIPDIQ
jgi:hypothetical protein